MRSIYGAGGRSYAVPGRTHFLALWGVALGGVFALAAALTGLAFMMPTAMRRLIETIAILSLCGCGQDGGTSGRPSPASANKRSSPVTF